MLEKRTNLLLSQKDYQMLVALAVSKGVSVGKLIREAIQKQYKRHFRKIICKLRQREEVISQILSLWQDKELPRKIDYKKLIELGRKY